MQQQGDYNASSSSYYQFPHSQNPNPNPNPNPIPNPSDSLQNQFASAPPFTSDYAPYASNYPPYPQNPDPISPSPTAPSYSPTPNPNLNSFSSPPQPSSFPPFESHIPYQPPSEPQCQYPPYDQHPTTSSYASSTLSSSAVPPNPTPNSSYPPVYLAASSASYTHPGPFVPPAYESPYESSVKFDYGAAYVDDKYRSFDRSRSDLGSDLYAKRPDSGTLRYGTGRDEMYGDGVYAYDGGKVEPYGARGTAPKSSPWPVFDDYGRSISLSSPKESSYTATKVVKAVPKTDTNEDVKSGVQKFRVKLLAESGGQSTMDVLCQIGLDGIRMLDPSTSRTLRIYPLENITRCEKFDSSTFAFWSKSPVDIEPRRIRLQSTSYTTNTLLDTVTAATIQFKEMGGSRRPTESLKTNEQPTEKKKGLVDWMNLIKPANEEKDHWVPDEAVTKCTSCGADFGAFVRKHHCRNCGDIYCDKCTHGRIALTAEENAPAVRVCDRCMAVVTQRLSNAKEAANKPVPQSHEDLARKLQEELERNRKASGSKSEGSGRRMKEVECPTCTVHLQVQVPSSGSETIECGVCQHPFLVSAH